MKDIDKAIAELRKNYKKALTLAYVRNPVAWALYQTWQTYHKKECESMKCKDCRFYDWDEKNRHIVGRPCTNPPKNGWRTDIAYLKPPTSKACKRFERS